MKRHLQVRFVKDPVDQERQETAIPFEEVSALIQQIFIGIAGLIMINGAVKLLLIKRS